MCTLPFCCSNDSQKCEWKIINTEKKNRKKRRKKAWFWKHKIGFFNFLRSIILTILPTFQSFIIFLLIKFFKCWSIISNFALLTVVFRSWESLFNSALNLKYFKGSYFCFTMCRFVATGIAHHISIAKLLVFKEVYGY